MIIKLKDAPRDGTPFILIRSNGCHVLVEYAEFARGWNAVEECDGAFFQCDDDDDFTATVPSNGEEDCLLLTTEQVKLLKSHAPMQQSPTLSPTQATNLLESNERPTD